MGYTALELGIGQRFPINKIEFGGFRPREWSKSLDLAIPCRMHFSKCKNVAWRPHLFQKKNFKKLPVYWEIPELPVYWEIPELLV